MSIYLALSNLSPLLAADQLMEHVLPHPVTKVGPIELTNHTLMLLLVAVVMLVIFSIMGQQAKNPVPSGLRNFFEAILSYLRTEVVRPALGAHADRFVPFLWTVFFFILFANLLGMVPFSAIFGLINPHWMHSFGGTATANLMVTAGLAIVAFFTIHISGVVQQIRIQLDPTLDPHHAQHDQIDPHGHRAADSANAPEAGHGEMVSRHAVVAHHAHAQEPHHQRSGKSIVAAVPCGIGIYIWNYAPHPQLGNSVLDFLLFVMLLVLEGIGALVKPFSLCVRLFANMLAGHLVLGALIGLIPFTAGIALIMGISIPVVLGCTALSLLELFVAFLQAYIFMFLTTLFIAAAVAPEH